MWGPFVDNLSELFVLLLVVLFKNAFWFTSSWSTEGSSSGFWSCNLEVALELSLLLKSFTWRTFFWFNLTARFVLRLSGVLILVSVKSVGDWLDVWSFVVSDTFETFFFDSYLLPELLSFSLLDVSTAVAFFTFAIALVFDCGEALLLAEIGLLSIISWPF